MVLCVESFHFNETPDEFTYQPFTFKLVFGLCLILTLDINSFLHFNPHVQRLTSIVVWSSYSPRKGLEFES